MTSVALIGAGSMGANHARVLATLPECHFVGVYDADPQRAEDVASAHGSKAYRSLEDLLEQVDAAVVATPSELHEASVVPLLERGIDVLVEKPISIDAASATRMVQAAEAREVILMVGHVERFNPAVVDLPRFVTEPVHLRFTRVGPFSPRVTTDVVSDLMVHDLDIALALARSQIRHITAVGQKVRTDSWDLVSALVTFDSGITASLMASRIGQNKVREIVITERDASVSVDLLRQDVTISSIHTNEYVNEGGTRYRQSGILEIPLLETRGEPLVLELRDFLGCVVARRAPVVDGRRALETLLAVEGVHRALAGGD